MGKRIEITGIARIRISCKANDYRINGEEPPVFTGFLRDITER